MSGIKGPVREIPFDLLGGYAMHAQGADVPIYLKLDPNSDGYMDDRKSSDFTWSQAYIDEFCERLQLKKIKDNNYDMGTPYAPEALQCLVEAFEKYDISNKSVAVVGSETPWIEAMLLNLGNQVTTVDYNVPKATYDKLTVIDYSNFQTLSLKFDCIVTFSSIEHSGLGRYGDELDPDGDLKAMKDIYDSLKPSGICMWGAPVRTDAVVWNAHRVYGPIRMPLLFKDFHEEEFIHPNWQGKQSLFDQPPYNEEERKSAPQPVIVLRKR